MKNLLRLRAKQLHRLPADLLIRNLASWEPLGESLDGYTVVIACMRALAPVAVANLRLCAKQASPGLREVLLVFDCPPEEIPPVVVRAVDEASRSLKIRLLGYNRRQARVSSLIKWGWVYSWLSWSLALAEARTLRRPHPRPRCDAARPHIVRAALRPLG